MSYDIAIVGAGITGLAFGYRILQTHPTLRVVIFERTKRIGGRADIARFHGVPVVTGAGVGRKGKDVLLTQLLKELGIPWEEFAAGHNNADQLRRLAALRTAAAIKSPRGLRFSRWARGVLGLREYRAFIVGMGFTDMENADAAETLVHYGLEDNVSAWTAMRISWHDLIHALAARFKALGGTIKLNAPVASLSDVTTIAKTVVIATPILTVKLLMPRTLRPLYTHVHSQPFLRVYAKFDAPSREIMRTAVPHAITVGTALQKIIPMDANKGVYMVAYADNASALAHTHHLTPDGKGAAYLYWSSCVSEAIGQKVRVTSIQSHWWTEGTHYYDPKADLSPQADAHRWHPAPNLFVIGEAVSHNQGWCEGALETVEACLKMYHAPTGASS